MAWTRRTVTSIAACSALAVVAFGMGTALAQDDAGSSPGELLERLGELEVGLPLDIAPSAVQLAETTTWGSLVGDATSVRAVLDTLEPELRALFVDADDADGDVAEAVALVAQGWLDVWTGSAAIAVAESHDLAFPVTATDGLGVAAGADELRGNVEVGLESVLRGRERHLEGYVALRELDAAELAAQTRIDARAEAAEAFDEQVLPDVLELLSDPTKRVVVPTERFETDAPGVRSRATSMTVVCVDREQLGELGGVATDSALAELSVDDADLQSCPSLPGLVVE